MIKIVKDYKLIESMLFDDKELYDRISDDYTDRKRWAPEAYLWLGWFEDNECLALLSVREETAIVLNIHIHMPFKNRGKNSVEIGKEFLKWLKTNCDKRFVKINIKIPIIFPDVIRYTEKVGFIKEGIDRLSHIKDGAYFDRVTVGLIMGEI